MDAVEQEKIEREEHDKQYKDSLPFHFKDYKIDPEAVIIFEDYCYKPGMDNIVCFFRCLALKCMALIFHLKV